MSLPGSGGLTAAERARRHYLINLSEQWRAGGCGRMILMCPAVGAGVIGIQCRANDQGLLELLRLLDDGETRTHVTAERTMLHGLQGHRDSPIAGHCSTTPDGQLALRGMVFTRDGGEFVHAMEWGPADRPAELGAYIAGVLLRKGARDLINGIPH